MVSTVTGMRTWSRSAHLETGVVAGRGDALRRQQWLTEIMGRKPRVIVDNSGMERSS
jgi:hypothetical protein